MASSIKSWMIHGLDKIFILLKDDRTASQAPSFAKLFEIDASRMVAMLVNAGLRVLLSTGCGKSPRGDIISQKFKEYGVSVEVRNYGKSRQRFY